MEARAPSFNHLQPASRASSRSKQANRAADTHHEHVLCQHLWRLGLRYRKNVRSLPGKPDVVFFASKVAYGVKSRLSRRLRAPKLALCTTSSGSQNAPFQFLGPHKSTIHGV